MKTVANVATELEKKSMHQRIIHQASSDFEDGESEDQYGTGATMAELRPGVILPHGQHRHANALPQLPHGSRVVLAPTNC
jgi:hypothetical protein